MFSSTLRIRLVVEGGIHIVVTVIILVTPKPTFVALGLLSSGLSCPVRQRNGMSGKCLTRT